MNSRRVICVHQGYELYGSDRIFIMSIEVLRMAKPFAKVEIILPKRGALATEIERRGFSVRIEPMWVLRRHDGIAATACSLLTLPYHVWRARSQMINADLVYLNTSVLFAHMLATRLTKNRVVLHVHELPVGFGRTIVSAVVSASRAMVLYNSRATAASFAAIRNRTVLYNGVEDCSVANAPPPLEHGKGECRVLVVGRINDWKGQDLLLEAVAMLPWETQDRVRIRFAGDTFERSPALRKLVALADRLGLTRLTTFEGFVSDPTELYQWADVVVVPSKRPEPFGLVAIEAMMHSRPVIAARHGGLLEIVAHGRTGLLVPPRDGGALAAAIQMVVDDPSSAKTMGERGRERYLEKFSASQYRAQLLSIVEPE